MPRLDKKTRVFGTNFPLQCDEAMPSCSRCASNNYHCCYQETTSSARVAKGPLQCTPSTSNIFGSPTSSMCSESEQYYPVVENLLLPSSQLSPHSTPSLYSGCTQDEERPVQLSSPGNLNAAEFALLSHYLTHTSHAVAFDEEDLHALSVGFPNIAFGSKPVMSSLLALAAACKCHNLLKQSKSPLNNLELVQELLSLADRHHDCSLEEIQAAIHSQNTYDDVLANAALMVLYSSASHSVRIRIAEAARLAGRELSGSLLPQGSQWIGLIRAAHTASVGVLGTYAEDLTAPSLSSCSPLPRASPASEGIWSCMGTFSPEDGPLEATRRLFLPIVRSSFDRALDLLSDRAQQLFADWSESSPWMETDLKACLEALPTLKSIAIDAVFGSEKMLQSRPESYGKLEQIPFESLPKVSPWLGRYMARVTSLTSPKPLRRVIMSFLNLVPIEFLSIVQSVMVTMSASGDTPQGGTLNVVKHLAMDIFSHWLVFVTLLDGVWWIGDIGEWELGQAISLMKANEFHGEDGWWPESMHRVKRELTQHI